MKFAKTFLNDSSKPIGQYPPLVFGTDNVIASFQLFRIILFKIRKLNKSAISSNHSIVPAFAVNT